jgi:hypothetical protein
MSHIEPVCLCIQAGGVEIWLRPGTTKAFLIAWAERQTGYPTTVQLDIQQVMFTTVQHVKFIVNASVRRSDIMYQDYHLPEK